MHMSVQNVSINSNTSSNKSNSVEHSNKQRTNFKTNYIDNNNNKNEKYNYGLNDKNCKNKNNKYKERVAHHRNSYDSSSFNNTVTTSNNTNTTPITNKTNKAIPIKIPIKKTTFYNNKNNNLPASNNKATLSPNNNNIKTNNLPNTTQTKTTKTRDDLIEQFENLKSKAEYFADKDPDFTARLLNFATKISTAHQLNSAGDLFTQPGMESSYYPNAYNNHHHTRYSHPSVYSSHSTYHTQPSNIYSTFNSTVFYNNHHSGSTHHRTHPQPAPPPCASSAPSSPQPPNTPSPAAQPTQTPTTQHSSSRTSNSNRTHNSDSTNSNFKRYSTNASNSHSKNYKDDHYGRYNAYNTYPSHHYNASSSSRYATNHSTDPAFHNNIYASHYYQHYSQSDHTPFIYSYHNQDGPEDIFLILEDTYDPNKLIVQMTRTHLGPNGEQQRVTVERDFRNETELNAFLKEFEENLHKTTTKHTAATAPPSTSSAKVNRSNSDDFTSFTKSPGVVVVEEPGEEPKLYRQDTGELVTPTNSSFIDPIIKEENDEHPNELPKGKEKAKYPTSHSKLYKDIDELIENLITEDQNLKSKTFHKTDSNKDTIYSSNSYSTKSNQKEKIQKRYSFPPREEKEHNVFKKSFHQTATHFSPEEKQPENRRSDLKDIKSNYFNDPKRSPDTFSSSKSDKINKESNKDLLSDHGSSKSCKDKKTDLVTQRLIMSNHKLNKKDYNTNGNCHRSSSTRSVNRKLKFRTLNEKDLKKSNRIPEKIKKTIKQTIDSPILSTSKSPTNGHHKDKMFSSKPDKNGDYSHNRVSFSFQPTTEYLQHFRNVGLTKLGAASSLKSKDALYQRANLPRSQSVITCHQNLSETPEFSSKIDEVNESNLENKESSETISHRYSQHYAKFDSDSSNTTVEESQTTSFKEKDSIKSKNYKKLKSALNVPKNISKSVEMISSKKSTDSKKLDPKKNLDKINEYFSSNTQLTNSKSNKKMDSTSEKPTFIKNIKIIKPIPTTPITKSETVTKKPDDKDDKKKLPTDIKIPIIKKKNQQKDKNSKFSTKDDFPDIDDSDINEEEEEQLDRVESTKEKVDEFDVNETDDYEEDDTDDEARNQPSYDYYKTYNSDKNNYHYDTNLYARQSEIYNSYRTHPSPAFFQPGFYPRSNATSVQQQPDLIQSSNSQNVFSQQQQQQQHHHHHMQYHTHQPYFSKQSSYYGSWYGSTPSLRVPVRSQNRQSSYFN